MTQKKSKTLVASAVSLALPPLASTVSVRSSAFGMKGIGT